jgi:hypothetical protein
MHQTTLRLSPDLWAALEDECARLGVSVAQYLREAAIARLAYSAGREGDPDYEAALVYAGIPAPRGRDDTAAVPAPDVSISEALGETRETLSGLRAQSRLARSRAQALRAQAVRERATVTRAGRPRSGQGGVR